ncbi:MAG: DUF192 domain-containing protein [Burkholderiales bacterium]|nr:MAG: DUF192 domain-containing protein [Burkholderiales bacterium]
MKKLLVAAAFALVSAMPAFAQSPAEPLTIQSGDKTHTFQVEFARTLPEITKGLTGRPTLAKDHGMFLDFRNIQEQYVLNMKGVQVDLDMLFLDTDGTIRAIATNARAGSLRTVAPGIGSSAVLQISAGQAVALGLKPGDKVQNKLVTNGG